MRTRTVAILVVLCVVVVGVAWVVKVVGARRGPGWVVGQRIAPGFPLNEIERIVVRTSEGTVTIGKEGGTWRVAEYYDYPANFGKVAELLQQVYEMKVGQHQRVRGGSLGRLRLVGPAAAGAEESGQGTAVQFFTKGGTPVFEMIVGNQKQRARDPRDPYSFAAPEGTYLRLASATAGASARSETVLLVKDIIALPGSAEGWIERQVLNVPAEQVREISVSPPGGEATTLWRTNSTDGFSISGLGPTQQVNSATATSLAGALSYFTIQKVVAPAEASTNRALERAWSVRVRTADGITYALRLADTNAADAYARLEVSYDASKAEVGAEGGDTAKEKADLLNARFGSWLYVLPSYKISELRKTREELVTAAVAPEADEAEKEEKGESKGADEAVGKTNEVSETAGVAGERIKEQQTVPEQASTEPVERN
ncbi:MAG: DUF4340 domain-containing protein [bacterium]|nr:DUF4340 domain-containing protein [bacterium]